MVLSFINIYNYHYIIYNIYTNTYITEEERSRQKHELHRSSIHILHMILFILLHIIHYRVTGTCVTENETIMLTC